MSSDPTFGNCALPLAATDRILLGHGAGGKLTSQLIEQLIVPAFANPALAELDDQAQLTAVIRAWRIVHDRFVRHQPDLLPGRRYRR